MASSKFTVLGEVIAINPERPLKKGETSPFIGMDCLNPNQRAIAGLEKRVFTGSGSKFANGDTLLARITPCIENGKTAYVNILDDGVNGNGSTEFIVLCGMKGITDNRFVYYVSRSQVFRDYIIKRMEGTSGRQRVPNAAVANFELHLPTLDDQKRIGQVLGTLDDKIELNRRTNETLEAMAKALFKSWFVDFDPVREKDIGRKPARLDAKTAQLFPSAFEDSVLGMVPKGWKIARLSEHAEAAKGLSYKGSGLANAGMPMHNLNSVFEGGGYKHEGIKFYTGEYRERHLINAGEVIVTNTEQGHECLLLGYAAIVSESHGQQGLFTHHIYRMKIRNDSPVTPDFLCRLLNSQRMHELVSGYGNGTTVNMLPIDGVEQPEFVLPPKPLIDCFSGLAAAIRRRQDRILDENRTLAKTRDALLPKLLSGDLTVGV